ncbi:hypothetical protein M758_UG134400 [Ceratodon purpureus]|nr:hypothetical protein M758_UG134400 [Ceratodon purpureus]
MGCRGRQTVKLLREVAATTPLFRSSLRQTGCAAGVADVGNVGRNFHQVGERQGDGILDKRGPGIVTRLGYVTGVGSFADLGVRRFAAVASVGERDLGVGEGEELVQVEEAGAIEDRQVENGLAMFTSASSLVDITGDDVMKYITFSEEDQLKYFGEGLPRGVAKEFEVTKANSLLIRPKVLHLCNFLERHVTGKDAFNLPAEGANPTKAKKHILLDGPEGSGKSVAMAMLVQWARARGWLVFYIPSGRGWTYGSLYYRNEETGLVETPVTAQMALEGFLKSHSELLDTLPCNIADPVPLGEGAGVPRVRGPQEFTLPEGATLKQLVEKGLSMSHAGVGTVVRLRKELSLVKDVHVLIAIDDYNSWFVFTEYGVKAKKPIHAHQLEMVRAFRPMTGSKEMMVTAFSHSNAVGKLPVHLPDVPKGVRFEFPRYSPVEASTALQYYHSREVTVQEPGDADVIRLYYLTGGNGKEIRNLSRFL